REFYLQIIEDVVAGVKDEFCDDEFLRIFKNRWEYMLQEACINQELQHRPVRDG
ncbi:hypothetical protein QYM36_007049, partial [Artemia franciscana]